MKIAILGAGAWGSGLAIALSEKHHVTLCARDRALASAIAAERCNARYLPGVAVPARVVVTADLGAAFSGQDMLLVATPTAGLRDVLEKIRTAKFAGPIVWACKGFEQASGKLPHQVAAEVLGAGARCGALSGPSFALEVARGLPTALTLAARDAEFAKSVARELHQPTLRVYYSTDVVGVEISGAVKNVMAIAAGISDGLGLGLNARAALITRGLAELARLGAALGGRAETFMGLAGAGDLILTCTGDLSRNRRVGLLLAKGEPLAATLEQLGHVAEGVFSARAVESLAAEKRVDMPITRAVCGVLFRGASPREAANALLARDPREEN
ncbi:MAG TPA: NAD(P)H-dependent glycerol-3-phosphate dehydrogenase [Burkholderiales bacterium]|nr:NAD(P)H-dependent glycerol-3-phosphate dehydrogenase [Burkholderiales bacterium]